MQFDSKGKLVKSITTDKRDFSLVPWMFGLILIVAGVYFIVAVWTTPTPMPGMKTDVMPAILDVAIVEDRTRVSTPVIPECNGDDGSLNPEVTKGMVCRSNWTPTPMAQCPVKNDKELCIMPEWEVYLEEIHANQTPTPEPGTAIPWAGGGNYPAGKPTGGNH